MFKQWISALSLAGLVCLCVSCTPVQNLKAPTQAGPLATASRVSNPAPTNAIPVSVNPTAPGEVTPTVTAIAISAAAAATAAAGATSSAATLLAASAGTATSTLTPPPTQTPYLSATPTPTATAINCMFPSGWVPYSVKASDTYDTLALIYQLPPDQIRQSNCMVNLAAGMTIFVPSFIPPTKTIAPPATPNAPCGAPAGWVRYIVQPGDTLFRLSAVLSVSTSQLQFANCMGYNHTIYVGQLLYVPFYPPPPPTATRGVIYTPTVPANPSATPLGQPTATLKPPVFYTATKVGAFTATPKPTLTLKPPSPNTPTKASP